MKHPDPPVFPFPAPTPELVAEYSDVFGLSGPLPLRALKVLFDRSLALAAIVGAAPVYLAVVLALKLEGWWLPAHSGPLFSSYISKTCRGRFWKRKFRILKRECIDLEAAAAGRWGAYKTGAEWDPANLTYVGRVLKAFYLDELPQLLSILAGHMSFVGPRPLAEEHYDRLVEQGNKPRQLIQGGLFSEMSVSKGQEKFFDPRLDLDYVRRYRDASAGELFRIDIRIILTGLKMVKAGEGH